MAKSYRSNLELMSNSGNVSQKEVLDFGLPTPINVNSQTGIFDYVDEAFKNLELKE